MLRGAMRTLRVQLPEDVYAELKVEAGRMKRGIGTVAGEALGEWVRARRKAARHREIAEFAREFAGTDVDLDVGLESAGLELLGEDFNDC